MELRIADTFVDSLARLIGEELHGRANNKIDAANVDKVIRVIRNALPLGSIVYLDKDGFENHGEMVKCLAFLSRYEEDEKSRAKAETYRLLATTEESFFGFLRCWASWLHRQGSDTQLKQAA